MLVRVLPILSTVKKRKRRMKDNVERYKRVPTTNGNLYLQQLCLEIARAMYSICYSHSHSHSDIATNSMYRNRKLEIAIRDRVFGGDPLF